LLIEAETDGLTVVLWALLPFWLFIFDVLGGNGLGREWLEEGDGER
jgi:hypothetical protein